jgi:hypothetical protein
LLGPIEGDAAEATAGRDLDEEQRFGPELEGVVEERPDVLRSRRDFAV